MADEIRNIDFGLANKPREKKEQIQPIPVQLIDNPFFGKSKLTLFEAMDAINFLSMGLMSTERRRVNVN